MDKLQRTESWIETLIVLVIMVYCIQGVPVPVTQPPQNESMSNAKAEVDKPTEGTNVEDALTPQFVRKVFSAFFEELKNRPDVVDEILKQEAYRMLENWAEEEENINQLPSQLDNLPTIDANQPIPVYYTDDADIDSQGQLQELKRKSDVALTNPKSSSTEENQKTESNGESTALQSDATVNQGNAKAEASSNPNEDDAVVDSGPYYYYLYYDDNENQTPNSQVIDEENQLAEEEQYKHNNGKTDSGKSQEKNIESRTQLIGETNKENGNNMINDSPTAIEPEDAQMERIVTDVKGKTDSKESPTPIQNKIAASKTGDLNEKLTDEETELASLAS